MGELWEVEVAPDPHSGEKTHQPTTQGGSDVERTGF